MVAPATALGVRRALQDTEDTLRALSVPKDSAGSMLLVLAEVMNNVVEHAYCHMQGTIDLTLQDAAGHIDFTVVDGGTAMPGCQLPQGAPAPIPDDKWALPEGGFGWHLIHILAEDLQYFRVNDGNVLRFSMPR